MKALRCPSCGAGHTLANPGILTLVCDYCQTTIFIEDEAASAGEKSIVAEPRSVLSVGATGTVAGAEVLILGRVQFDWGGGRWDEWFATGPGQDLWLVEDERRYSLERQVTGLSVPHDATLGTQLWFEGRVFEVTETRVARCVGGEGQLPRTIGVGEEYAYLDAIELDGDGVLSIERGADGEVVAFLGEDVAPQDLRFGDVSLPPPMDFTEGAAIQCSSCGAGFTLPAQESVVTAVCTSCGTQLELTPGGQTILGVNPGRWDFPLKVGDQGALDGVTWEIVGRLLYQEGFGEHTREYLLWAKGHGYRWLAEYEGSWTLQQATRRGPEKTVVEMAWPRYQAKFAGRTWTCFERGNTTLIHVDGALPWRATVGDRGEYLDFIDPPHVFSVELGGDEIERFVGHHVDAKEVYEAFGRASAYKRPLGVGAAAPRYLTGTRKAMLAVAAVFTLVNLVAMFATLGSGQPLLDVTVAPTEVAAGTWQSEPFAVPEGATTLGLSFDSNLDNAWLAVESELLSVDGEETLGVTGAEISYYHGYEGGESWSEGSRDTTDYYRAPPAGQYRLGLTFEGSPTPLRVRVTEGAKLTRYPMGMFVVCLALVAWMGLRHVTHENLRWGVGDD